jgi:hypothetical protein
MKKKMHSIYTWIESSSISLSFRKKNFNFRPIIFLKYGHLKKRLHFGLVETAFFPAIKIVMGRAGRVEGGAKLFFS